MPKYAKTVGVDYNDKPVAEKLKEKTDLYLLYSVIVATECAFGFVNVLSGSLAYHKELLQTGTPIECYTL